MKTSTKKTFKANLQTITKSGETVRVAVQNACIQAVEHYSKTGDTGFLTSLMEVAKANRGIRTLTLQKFIQEHANVKYSKVKNAKGEEIHVFKKATGKGGEVVVQEITTFWYDFTKDGEAVAEVDFIAQAKALLKRMSNNEKPLKDGTQEKTEELAAHLQSILTA
jgi:hypothetical protein